MSKFTVFWYFTFFLKNIKKLCIVLFPWSWDKNERTVLRILLRWSNYWFSTVCDRPKPANLMYITLTKFVRRICKSNVNSARIYRLITVVFAKTSQKRSFSLIENERFELFQWAVSRPTPMLPSSLSCPILLQHSDFSSEGSSKPPYSYAPSSLSCPILLQHSDFSSEGSSKPPYSYAALIFIMSYSVAAQWLQQWG